MTGPRYPEVTVELIGHDGNAFSILGRVQRALKKAEQAGQADPGAADEFMTEATSGDYDHLLATAMSFVEVL